MLAERLPCLTDQDCALPNPYTPARLVAPDSCPLRTRLMSRVAPTSTHRPGCTVDADGAAIGISAGGAGAEIVKCSRMFPYLNI